jgi:hypothetical protein
MRGLILLFVVGVIAVAIALNVLKQRHEGDAPLASSTTPSSDPVASRPSVMDQAREAAASAKENAADKLEEWNLSGSDIKEDLARTGEVVRAKARAAGESLALTASKAKVIGTVKAKYALDRELSARAVDIDYDSGRLTLRGTVPSEALIGKAVALALDTEGVTEVRSLLTVAAVEAP